MEIIGIGLFVVLIVVLAVFALWVNLKRLRTWKVVAEGKVAYVRLKKQIKTVAGGMFGVYPIYAKVAEIHFYDGTYFTAWDVDSVPSRGENIRVLQNSFEECRIEKIEDKTKSHQ